MPETKELPVLPTVNLDSEPLPGALEQLKQTYALELVKRTFTDYEAQRVNNHDQRFVTQDQLYLGWVPPKMWPNTNIPRASYSHNITFDQLESALPSINQALFGSGEWFSVEADAGKDPKTLKQIKDTLTWVVQHAKDDIGGTAVNEMKLGNKDVLLRGNGGIFLEWDGVRKRPVIRWVDLRNLYIDPGLTVPSLDEAQAVIERRMCTIKELKEYKEIPGMSIPDDNELYTLAQNAPFVQADQTKAQQEAYRGINYQPGVSDFQANPADRKVEVLIYYSKERIIWVFNRKYVAYNENNPYGFIPYCFAPCYIVQGRWYAASVPDQLENIQRYVEGLMNARLDRVHLSMEPPRLIKRSALTTASNFRWNPGKVITVDDPKDFQLVEPQDVIPNVYTEIEFMQQAAEKRTGINSFGQGVPRGGNVNRTATGVSAQTSGASMRLLDIVENIENYMLVPMLYKLYKMIQLHTDVFSEMTAKDENGQTYKVPAEVFNSDVNFVVYASSKMATKDKLMQVFPFVTQYLLNGPFMQQLAASGNTVDVDELLRFLQDATGTATQYSLVRKMTPEEQQKASQPDPTVQAEQQQKQNDTQTRLQIARESNQTELQKAQIMKTPNPQEAALAQQQMQQEMELKKQQADQELQQEAMAAQIKMMLDKRMADIKIQAEREKRAQELQSKQVEHQLNIQQTVESSRVNAQAEKEKLALQRDTAQQQFIHDSMKNDQALQFGKEKQKLVMAKPRLNQSTRPKHPTKKAK